MSAGEAHGLAIAEAAYWRSQFEIERGMAENAYRGSKLWQERYEESLREVHRLRNGHGKLAKQRDEARAALEASADPTYFACCPEHGLHGQRTECFECGGPVDQVAFVEVHSPRPASESPGVSHA